MTPLSGACVSPKYFIVTMCVPRTICEIDYSALNNDVILKSEIGVVQGH